MSRVHPAHDLNDVGQAIACCSTRSATAVAGAMPVAAEGAGGGAG
jgi:hypothetical protein